jgi:hypothetical protein
MDRRSFLALPALAAAPPETPQLTETIRAYGLSWQVISAADWKIDGETLSLATARPQQANPRRPIQFALAETEPIDRFTIEVDVRRSAPKGSLIIVYAWRKDGYFNYLHLSDDAPSKVEVHNGLFHCYGGDRVRISPTEGPGSLVAEGWHKVKFNFDGRQGLAQAWVDGQTTPALTAADLSLTSGRIGLGSFFNTADFRGFRLTR